MAVIVFDVNETMSDMSPLAQRFIDVGAPGSLLATWFASTLRDGSALSTAGTPRPFAEVARAVLGVLWAQLPGFTGDPNSASDHVLAGFTSLELHPDIAPGVRELAERGHRLVTLSNGATSVAQDLLARAGLRDSFEAVLSVDDAGAWKPAAQVYRYAASVCAVAPEQMVMVAVHPWDLHGAAQVGMRTALIDRSRAPYPDVFAAPDFRVGALPDLATVLG